VSKSRGWLGDAARGAAFGLIAAFVLGALIGLVFGAPWFTEPGPEVPPGLDGAAFGALVYGTLGCIPAVLLAAVVGGPVGANRPAGDGNVYQGLVMYDAVDSLILQTGPATTVRLPGETVVARRVSPRSLMPAGLLDSLSDQEIVDLYAYLKTFGNKTIR
jgi:hypothetical protein